MLWLKCWGVAEGICGGNTRTIARNNNVLHAIISYLAILFFNNKSLIYQIPKIHRGDNKTIKRSA